MTAKLKRKPAARAGIRITAADAAVVKGMLLRGDRQSDIAAYYGCNQGEIAKIHGGYKHRDVVAASDLPAPGPYKPIRSYHAYVIELEKVHGVLVQVLGDIEARLIEARQQGEQADA